MACREARIDEGHRLSPCPPKPTRDPLAGLHPDRYFTAPNPPLRHSIACVAIAAFPVRFDVLAEVFEDKTRATLCRLTVLHHGAQLRSILNAACFVVGEISAQIDRGQSLRR